MKPNILQLLPRSADEKRWVAEITGEDPTYHLKRSFVQEEGEGVWEIYDGWYQIHGECPGVTPFSKEYVLVKEGRMHRHIPYRVVLGHLEEIKAMGPQRMERMRRQIYAILDEIKREVDYEPLDEGIERQKEDVDMADDPDQLHNALNLLKKRKKEYIKQYLKTIPQNPQEH